MVLAELGNIDDGFLGTARVAATLAAHDILEAAYSTSKAGPRQSFFFERVEGNVGELCAADDKRHATAES
jgi:hypothetical protein